MKSFLIFSTLYVSIPTSVVAVSSLRANQRQLDTSKECSTVRCKQCPTGQVIHSIPGNCCQCVPQKNDALMHCSTALCEKCPAGESLDPTPGKCCHCVPDLSLASKANMDCSAVRCLACPDGQVRNDDPPPGNCCHCVPEQSTTTTTTTTPPTTILGQNNTNCNSSDDCRLFSNFCNGCTCDVLPMDDPTPTCMGTMVSCFFDPCDGKYAMCNTDSTTNQCEISTMDPVCSLPQDFGPCEALVPKWYYNTESGTCEEFFYGGCEGNANNFDTQDACIEKCLKV